MEDTGEAGRTQARGTAILGRHGGPGGGREDTAKAWRTRRPGGHWGCVEDPTEAGKTLGMRGGPGGGREGTGEAGRSRGRRGGHRGDSEVVVC